MSYILDALRRADAERSRGAVPGLHDQNGPADGEPAARNYTPLIWAAGAAGALVVAGVVLLWAPWRAKVPAAGPAPLGQAPQLAAQGRDNLPAAAQGETPPAQPGGLAPASLPVAPPMGRMPDGAASGPGFGVGGPNGGPPSGPPPGPYPPPAGAAPTFANGLPPGASAPQAMAQAAPGAQAEHYGPPAMPQQVQQQVSQQPQAQQQPAPAVVAATPAPAHATSGAVPNINELSASVRAQLPRLVVGGAIYSESPSARMVILNGQVWHEGEKPAADTVLEQVRLKSAVLNFRGQRYEINY